MAQNGVLSTGGDAEVDPVVRDDGYADGGDGSIERPAVGVALWTGLVTIVGLAFCLAVFGGFAISMSATTCPSELSAQCASRAEVVIMSNCFLQTGAVVVAVWAFSSNRLDSAQRFVALGVLAMTQLLLPGLAVNWVTAA